MRRTAALVVLCSLLFLSASDGPSQSPELLLSGRAGQLVGENFAGSELERLIRAGMKSSQAPRAEARVGAEILVVQERLGFLRTGMMADLTAAASDPTENLSGVRDPTFVMNGGVALAAP